MICQFLAKNAFWRSGSFLPIIIFTTLHCFTKQPLIYHSKSQTKLLEHLWIHSRFLQQSLTRQSIGQNAYTGVVLGWIVQLLQGERLAPLFARIKPTSRLLLTTHTDAPLNIDVLVVKLIVSRNTATVRRQKLLRRKSSCWMMDSKMCDTEE